MTAQRDDPLRTRILDGLAKSLAHREYRDTTVVNIVNHARTSKREFYQRFSNKDECFLELMASGADDLATRLAEAVDPSASWTEQVRQAVEAYVVSIEARPGISQGWVRDLPTLGAMGRPMQRRNYDQLTDMLVQLTDTAMFRDAGIAPLTPATAVILLAGLRELAAQTVEDGIALSEIVEPAVATSIALLRR